MKPRSREWLLLLLGGLVGFIILFAIQELSIQKPITTLSPQEPIRKKLFSTKPSPISYDPGIVTLNSIFLDNHEWVATLSAERIRTILATGDVSLARQVNIQIRQKNNSHWPFEKTKSLLESADITYINLESPLIENCPVINTGFVFCGEASNVKGLVFAGVDVANFANNHASNFGVEGVDETVQLLSQNNILVSGVDGPIYKSIDGMTFAFLGYNEVNIQPGVTTANEEIMKKEIAEARKTADIIVVQFHWGAEYIHQPTTNQKKLGYLAIDLGADLVIGNHPHWYQAVEIYHNKFIAYSHGNFVFDQMWSQKTREGVVGKYTFFDNHLIDVEFIPILIHDFGQPAIIGDQNYRNTIINSMQEESARLVSL